MEIISRDGGKVVARLASGRIVTTVFGKLVPNDVKVSDHYETEDAFCSEDASWDASWDAVDADPYAKLGDIHQNTADSLGVDRKVGKVVNFGRLYGMSSNKLQEVIDDKKD